MKFLNECFEEHWMEFATMLRNAGFSGAQAGKFLPEAATCLLTSEDYCNPTRAINDLISTNPAQILNSIDVEYLAEKLGITPNLASTGLSAIKPLLSNVMSQKKDGIVDAIISLAWHPNGNLTDAAKRIFH